MMTTRLCELLSCKKLIDWLIDYLVLSDACLLPKESGSCFNQDLRFYWDAEVAECRPLMYSGCGGNGNNFATQDDCYAACGRAVTTPDGARRRYRRRRYRPGDCYEAVSAGTTCDADRDGDGVTPRWYFDSEHGNCLAFYFNGCNGNGNNFHSYDDCIALCFKGFMLACVKPSTHWRQSRMSKRLSTKTNTCDKAATKATVADTFDFVADLSPVLATVDCRRNGNNLNIYESRDDPVTSDVISIQSQTKT